MDMPRIFAVGTGRSRRVVAGFLPLWRMCALDPAYLLRPDVGPALVAAAIVHEAVHARLIAYGIPHGPRMAVRIERACRRAEESFLGLVSNHDERAGR